MINVTKNYFLNNSRIGTLLLTSILSKVVCEVSVESPFIRDIMFDWENSSWHCIRRTFML